MSDTPRTDAEEFVHPDFARTLERELAAMTKERDELRKHAERLERKGHNLAALLCSWCPKEVRGDSLIEWDEALAAYRASQQKP